MEEKKRSTRKNTPAKESAPTDSPKSKSSRQIRDTKTEHKKLLPQGDLIFSLDIGTRTIVGVLGEKKEDLFTVVGACVLPHTNRAMIDGQIEDIAQVSKVVKKVCSELERQTGIKLSSVALAAAGRSLKTQHVKVDIDVSSQESITEEMVKSFEMEAISKAQSILDDSVKESLSPIAFYCVGHSVVNYYLDDYPIKSFIGHKGKTATVDMIAAFLPSLVVESLYAVMDQIGLEVGSLTLEPIAAMNVIVPPDTRLINIALVDIGAGTSDIALAKNGSIVAYAMATIAGDEITEEIIRRYLVDFDTAESLKLALSDDNVSFKDILGFEYTMSSTEFVESISPAIELLANTICENIVQCNGSAPAAVFLVGGGSKIPGLVKMVAQKLSMPENRIAVGGYNTVKYLSLGKHADTLKGPEFVTPIGIGITATIQKGYDFATITLNDKKVRVFNRERLTILDLISVVGFKATNIIGRSGRNLSFTFNGESQLIKGEIATPATLTVNDIPAHIGSTVKQGDKVVLIPAQNGISAEVSILDFSGELSPFTIFVDGEPYPAGVYATVNGKTTDSAYIIQNFDDVRTFKVSDVATLKKTLPFDTDNLVFARDNTSPPLTDDDPISPHDTLITREKTTDELLSEQTQQSDTDPDPEPGFQHGTITVTLNGQSVTLPPPAPHLFLEVTAIADLDLQNPQGTGRVIQTKNGQEVNYSDTIEDGDDLVLFWENA